jgi:DNA-binding NtrC family response regulator
MQKTIRLLLVDDEVDYLAIQAKLLQRRGFNVSTALSGPEALNLLAQQEFDSILLDMRMPGMDGLETIEAIREKGIRIPILIVSGIADYARVTSALKGGIADFIPKTCPVDELTAAIENACEHHHYERLVDRRQSPEAKK